MLFDTRLQMLLRSILPCPNKSTNHYRVLFVCSMNQEPPRKPPPPQRPPFPTTRSASVCSTGSGTQPSPVVASPKPQPNRPVPPQKPTTLNRAISQQSPSSQPLTRSLQSSNSTTTKPPKPTPPTTIPVQSAAAATTATPTTAATTTTTNKPSTTISNSSSINTATSKAEATFNSTTNQINSTLAKMNPAMEKCSNFMRQFRDAESRELKKLTANQFMEVWGHYDEDCE